MIGPRRLQDLGYVLKIGLSCVFMYSTCPSVRSSTCLTDSTHHLFISEETGVWIDLHFSHVLNARIVKSNLESRCILFLSKREVVLHRNVQSCCSDVLLENNKTQRKAPWSFLDRCGHFVISHLERKPVIVFSNMSSLEKLVNFKIYSI
jgi:hypothetical protein